jgi:hypothetical protein
MSLTLSGKRKYPVATEGSHQAILAAIVDVGIETVDYGEGQKERDVCRFIWLIDETDTDGSNLLIFQKLAKSTHEKSTMCKVIKGMTGQAPKAGFTLEQILGGNATLILEHSDDGNFANISKVIRPDAKAKPVSMPEHWEPPKHRDGEGETFTYNPTARTKDVFASETEEEELVLQSL